MTDQDDLRAAAVKIMQDAGQMIRDLMDENQRLKAAFDALNAALKERLNAALKERLGDQRHDIVQILRMEQDYWGEAYPEDEDEWSKATIIAHGAITNALCGILLQYTPEEYKAWIAKRHKLPGAETDEPIRELGTEETGQAGDR